MKQLVALLVLCGVKPEVFKSKYDCYLANYVWWLEGCEALLVRDCGYGWDVSLLSSQEELKQVLTGE